MEKEMRPVIIQQTPATISPVVVSKPGFQSIKKEEKKTNHFNKAVADTVPVKKKKLSNNKNNNNINQPLPQLSEQEIAAADAALQEIIQLKNQIGEKKESIGIMKEQLNTKEGAEKEKILNEIQQKRGELYGKRRELDLKRAEWEQLKAKARIKQLEQKNNSVKPVIDHEKKSATLENNNDAIINDAINGQLKKTLSVFSTDISFETDQNKVHKKEFKYEMNLKPKDPPPNMSRAAPPNKINPGAPAKEIRL
jgi:hypothetical protein